MFRLLVTILANALGIYASARLIEGFSFTGTYLELAIAGLALALINWFIRPIVKFVSGPFIFITLGLFMIVVNMAMLFLLDLLIPSLVILSLLALLLATLLIGFINMLIIPSKKK